MRPIERARCADSSGRIGAQKLASGAQKLPHRVVVAEHKGVEEALREAHVVDPRA